MQKYTLIFQLKLPGYKGKDRTSGKERTLSCVPSWNDVLSLEQWGQLKLKGNIQAALLSALRASVSDSSMTITNRSKDLSMLCATLIASLEIHQRLRELKRANAKQEKAKKNAPTSKSSPVLTPKPPSSEERILDWKGSKWLVKTDAKGGYSIVRTATLEDVRTFRPL